MQHHHPAGRQAGFTFAELAFGLLILVIAAVVLVNHLTINYQTTLSERDRVFAYGKAQAMLSEIQGFVDRGNVDAAWDLDVLDDGVVNKDTLSIQTDTRGQLVPPNHVLSNNYQRDGQWLWSRRITVAPFQGLNNRNVRYVTVRIYKRDQQGTERPVADLSSVINSRGQAFPTTQVFDVYLLAVENIPGWWVYMDSIRPFVESTISDLEVRNPGLELRTHWITKASFGRNQTYRPFVNDRTDSWQTNSLVYYYPAKMPAGQASEYYYVPDNFKGHINLDGTDLHGWDPDLNQRPYALADYYNHAMRYPDELALWQARVDLITQREAAQLAARNAGTTPEPDLDDMSKEPTLRLFFEDLYTNPAKYKNALVINLHGELIPMPAMRNYSDPARDPEGHPRMRVVTHPEQLRYKRNEAGAYENVALRVYASNDNTQTYTGAACPPILNVPIAVDVVGMNLLKAGSVNQLDPTVLIKNLRGGVPVGLPGTTYFPFTASKLAGDASLVANEMYYSAQYVNLPGQEKYTRIWLYNTPVIAPQDVPFHGLAATPASQLYGMSYIPSPCETVAGAALFSRDLFATGDGPKNTARWTITIPATFIQPGTSRFVLPDGSTPPPANTVLKIRTRMWTSATAGGSGTMWPPASFNAPENLSVTYAWWADTKEAVPITERSQFIGDPRHNPYKDLLKVNAFTNPAPNFPDGYNWFHASNSGGGFTPYVGLNAANLFAGWRGVMNVDVPRFFQMVRKALVKSNCVYTTLTGFSYYYVGNGNDIGYDSANGYPSSIPVELTPFGAPGTRGYVDNITGARSLVRAPGAGYWVGLPWLGELYPDSQYTNLWMRPDANGKPQGNLPAGTAANQYWQAQMNSAYAGSNRVAFGTTLISPIQRTSTEGCVSLFNIGNSGSTFHHQFCDGTFGARTATGTEVATNYNFSMPTSPPISRPFGVATNGAGSTGDEFSLAPYSAERFVGTMFKTYYSHPTGQTGSGVVKLVDTANTNAAYIVVNGIDRTVASGSTFIAKWAMLSLVHSSLEAGSTTNTLRIKELPRAEITFPTDITELQNPTNVAITTNVTWKRWDGLDYTKTGTFAEAESELDYVLTYSNDGGSRWYYVQDDTLAQPGVRPTDPRYIVADRGTGPEVYDWPVPAARFPEGSYQLRVDCFRRTASINYSYHRTRMFIRR